MKCRLICKQACYEEMEKHYEEELQAASNNGEDREPVQKCDASCPDEMAGGFGFYRLDDEFKEGVDKMNDEEIPELEDETDEHVGCGIGGSCPANGSQEP